MEINEIKAFVKVVQTGSFTAAAIAMNTQKAHVSRLVSQLETKLKVRLLARTTRSQSLTEIGEDIYQRSQNILAELESVQIAADSAYSKPHGTLRLTCPVEFGQMRVSSWINGYQQRYPDVTIEANYTSRLVDVVDEGFDLAVRVGALPDSGLNARKIGEIDYGLFASAKYLEEFGEPKEIQSLKQHKLLSFNSKSWTFCCGKNSERIDFEPYLNINNVFALLNAAQCNQGIARLPLSVINLETLVRILPNCLFDKTPVHFLYPSARYLSPKVRTFIDYVTMNGQL